MLPCYPMLKDAGLVFNSNDECIAIAKYSHSGEKDQVKNSDFIELMPESDRHKVLKDFYCIICYLQFDKDVVFNIHNELVHKIRKPKGKKKQPDCFKKIQFDCNLCGKRCQSKSKYNEHFNPQHSAKVIREKCQLLKQKEETIANLKMVENGKYIKLLEKSVELIYNASMEDRKTTLCTICMEEKKNLIFFPCMHIAACTRCGQHQTIARCPICRKKIIKRQKVIIS